MAITIDTPDALGLGHTHAPPIGRIGESARTFAAARRHSRLVRLLRAGLPLATAGILVAYGLILAASWHLNAGRFRVGGVELTADDLSMKDPSYFGLTNDGGRYQIHARRAVVGFNQNAPIKLIDIGGDLVQTNNVTTKLKGKHGLFDNAKGELELYDGIEIDASNGLMARLSRATIYSKESKVVSKHPVSAHTPTGAVQASAMTMNTKTRLVQFRGAVAVRLLPSAQGTIGAGRDARQPVDVHSEELDVDDMQKTAHFRGKVVAMQGDTMLQTPYLFIKYEGKAAATLSSAAPPATDQGTRVTFLWARNGVEITAGSDRRVTGDLADFDVTADTVLFVGHVVATQDKNVLKGGRLFVDRKAGKTRLETPAEGNQPPGRIAATFYQKEGSAEAQQARPKSAVDTVQQAMLGSFKADPNAPMEVEANTLEMHDAGKKAIFSGNVKAQQGDFVVRTTELTAFYSGQTGFSLTNAADDAGAKVQAKAKDQGQIVRVEARQKVIVTSKDDQNATAEWADFDVKANTALLGGGVTIGRGRDVATAPKGSLVKIDLTTGMYRFEEETGPPTSSPKQPPTKQAPAGPAVSSNPPATPAAPAPPPTACPPGRQCLLVYPKDVKEKAKDLLKKAPAVDAH